MKKKFTWKIILAITVVVLSLFLAYPPKEKIHLGLDLRGGMHLVLQVITEDAINIETDQEIARLQELCKKRELSYKNIDKEKPGRFSILGISAEHERKFKDLLDEYFREWDYSVLGERISLSLRLNVTQYLKDQAVNQAVETIRNRVDQFGVSEPTIQRQGLAGDRIIVELPGVDNPDRVKNIIKTTALLEWKLVVAGPALEEEILLKDYDGKTPEGMEVLKGDPKRTQGGYYLVNKVAAVTGKDLTSARRSVDEWNRPAVHFNLNSAGASRFDKVTAENVGKQLAIILDGKVQSAPVIETRISGGSGIITGNFTIEEAEDLALILRAGALPASIKYLEERAIGPALGADSIRKGLFSTVIALILVMGFMLFYYRAAGVNANVALILNMILLMGALAYFKATLTLPGIAGIILTIGMAVDANVLIFERIKEELRAGKSVWSAIATGFSRALSAILDSNITTIISAVFLFQFGTGPVKGYAVTLIIGITASMFTAVFVSRLIFELTVSRKKKKTALSI